MGDWCGEGGGTAGGGFTLVLVAVMRAYLGKCVATWSLPNGQVNWLVTLAASMWMALFLVLGGLDAGIVRLFRRFGALLVVPLIGLQIVALSLVRSRWATPAAYGFFAALAVFAAHLRWNVIDTGVRCQRLPADEAGGRRKGVEDPFGLRSVPDPAEVKAMVPTWRTDSERESSSI